MAEITSKQIHSEHTPSIKNLMAWLELLSTLIDEVHDDITTIATFQAALTAKLDLDAGITDTDYASTLTEVVAPTAPKPSATHTVADKDF